MEKIATQILSDSPPYRQSSGESAVLVNVTTYNSFNVGGYEMTESIINPGAIFRDYIPEHLVRSGGLLTVPKPLARFQDRKIQLNQNSYDIAGCTYSAAMTIGANGWYKDWFPEWIQWFLAHKADYGRTGAGMYMDRAADMYCDFLNIKFPGEGRTYRMIDFYTERKKYLDDGHMIMIGSIINDKYIEEIKDGAVNAPRGKKDGIGHVRCLFAHTTYEGEGICENFLNVLPHNVIDLVALDELIKAEQFYHSAFIIYPSGKMPVTIKYPYSSIEDVQKREKKYPDLLPAGSSETVRAWIDLAQAGEDVYYNFVDFRGLFGVDKMIQNLDKYREEHKGL